MPSHSLQYVSSINISKCRWYLTNSSLKQPQLRPTLDLCFLLPEELPLTQNSVEATVWLPAAGDARGDGGGPACLTCMTEVVRDVSRCLAGNWCGIWYDFSSQLPDATHCPSGHISPAQRHHNSWSHTCPITLYCQHRKFPVAHQHLLSSSQPSQAMGYAMGAL